MGQSLVAVEFREQLLCYVARFHCGDEPWSKAAATWLSNPLELHGALKSIRDHGSSVWLFYSADVLVGFGSLGPWRYKAADGNVETIGYIPQIAVDTSFQGQPAEAPRGSRFAYQIVSHVLATALDRGFRKVALRVDSQNRRAVRFYERIGFVRFGDVEFRHGREFERMIVGLEPT